MTTKFRGSLDDLKKKIGTTGIGGEWAEAPQESGVSGEKTAPS